VLAGARGPLFPRYKQPTKEGRWEAIQRLERLRFAEHTVRPRDLRSQRFRTDSMEFLTEPTNPVTGKAVDRR
jgi:hypothetical protein